MTNSIYFTVLFVLFGIVCYTLPQAFDESYAIDDIQISIHKIEYTNNEGK